MKLQDQLSVATGSYVKGELSARFECEMKEEQAHLEYHIKVVGGNTNLSSLRNRNDFSADCNHFSQLEWESNTTEFNMPILTSSSWFACPKAMPILKMYSHYK